MMQEFHSWHISEENHNSKRYMHPSGHCSTIYNSQDMEATKSPSKKEYIMKMWYIHTMKFYSAIKKNEIMLFSTAWMDFFFLSFFLFFFFFFFFLALPMAYGVFQAGGQIGAKLLEYTTATEIPDLSRICNLHHNSRQCWTLNPLSKARD